MSSSFHRYLASDRISFFSVAEEHFIVCVHHIFFFFNVQLSIIYLNILFILFKIFISLFLAQELWHTSPVARVGSFWTRD